MSNSTHRSAAQPTLESTRSLRLWMSVLLVAVNIAVGAFYGLWAVADEWAVDRSEATHGFDPSMLLPNSVGLWIVANASLVLLIGLDVAWICLTLKLRTVRSAARAQRVVRPGEQH
ncbi:hypothetical protein ASF88_03550 [Leifsonia sp. Leaf336]|uniref:hypothetical protein n=1 Tax=Leifsonia sp. Leaf336 TaxID=1736341 RepID=UPI0006FA04CA|nr:hypothetical protein [Leifsonia sp. Leaf336]KQR53928.1 hypothetical protein ASF88_03550 [Leifsonia sp. Leaf336]